MRRRGIVMDLTVDSAVVLSADGEFCRLPRSADMAVGSEVSWESHDVAPNRGARARRWGFSGIWYRVGIAGAAACLAIAAGAWWSVGVEHPVEAYARVSIDINPSVAVTVNSQMVVIDATGMNADGRRLVSQLKLKGEPLKRAVSDVLNAAAQDGMLPDADTILISAAPAQSNAKVDQTAEKIATQAEQDVQSAIYSNPLVQKHHPKVYALGLSSMIWSAANQANISPGKLAAYLIASTEGQSVSLNQLQGETLGSILSSTKSKSAMQVLHANDVEQIEKWLKQLPVPTPSVVTSNAVPSLGHAPSEKVSSNRPAIPSASEHKGSSAETVVGNHLSVGGPSSNHTGKGPGTGTGNQASNKAQDSENSVTVHLGNSVITVPLGVPLLPSVNSQAHEQTGGSKNDNKGNHHVNMDRPWNDIRADDEKETAASAALGGPGSSGNSKKHDKEKKCGHCHPSTNHSKSESKNGGLLSGLFGLLRNH
jgi:hypothetical protein